MSHMCDEAIIWFIELLFPKLGPHAEQQLQERACLRHPQDLIHHIVCHH